VREPAKAPPKGRRHLLHGKKAGSFVRSDQTQEGVADSCQSWEEPKVYEVFGKKHEAILALLPRSDEHAFGNVIRRREHLLVL
jgi:hypothetical protein